ncbi:hypothetical protein AB9F41_36680, partial [Rhizobium leguminosarum]
PFFAIDGDFAEMDTSLDEVPFEGRRTAVFSIIEVEIEGEDRTRRFKPFLISAAGQVESLMANRLMTGVSDVGKGADVDPSG